LVFIAEIYSFFFSMNPSQKEQAEAEIRQSQTIKATSIKYGIPKSTLYDAYRLAPREALNTGPHPALGSEIEEALINFIHSSQVRGFPITTLNLRKTAARLASMAGTDVSARF
jgi:hypothetical protein